MIFPIQQQLSAAQTASDRRFQLSLLRAQRQDAEAMLEAATAALSEEMAAQKAIVQLQTTSMDALADALDAVTETAEAANQFAQEQAPLMQARQERMARALEGIQAAMTQGLADVLTWWLNRKATANGWIDRGLFAEGFPFPTGTVLWTQNAAPPGWIHCNGAEISKVDYAALYQMLGETYGPATDTTMFVLPAEAECPGYNAAAVGTWYPIIRI